MPTRKIQKSKVQKVDAVGNCYFVESFQTNGSSRYGSSRLLETITHSKDRSISSIVLITFAAGHCKEIFRKTPPLSCQSPKPFLARGGRNYVKRCSRPCQRSTTKILGWGLARARVMALNRIAMRNGGGGDHPFRE